MCDDIHLQILVLLCVYVCWIVYYNRLHIVKIGLRHQCSKQKTTSHTDDEVWDVHLATRIWMNPHLQDHFIHRLLDFLVYYLYNILHSGSRWCLQPRGAILISLIYCVISLFIINCAMFSMLLELISIWCFCAPMRLFHDFHWMICFVL